MRRCQMKCLESVLMRILTDRGFLGQVKDGTADLDQLSADEKEALISLASVGGVDAFVRASSEAMAQLLPQVLPAS